MADEEPAVTHYVPFWHHGNHDGNAEAICGTMILESDSTALPSCPRCEAYFEISLKKIKEAMDEPT